jgi:hypothetical protein
MCQILPAASVTVVFSPVKNFVKYGIVVAA